MWDALKQIAKNSSLYYKQLGLFVGIAFVGVILGGGFKYLLPSAPQASSDIPRALRTTSDGEYKDYAITITKRGDVVVDGVKLRQPLAFEEDNARFLLVLIRESTHYVTQTRATVTLPEAVTRLEAFNPRIYAVHGVSDASYTFVDNRTISFTAMDIPEGATVSIELTFPRSYFDLPFLTNLDATLSTLPLKTWTIIGFAVPATSLLFLAYLLIRRWLGSLAISTPKVIETPPSTFPPAVIGTLYRGKIGAQEITATFLDLAQRGFLTLHYDHNQNLVLGKGASLYNSQANTLRPFEIFLLHQIFGDSGWSAQAGIVEASLNEELFSSKIAMAMVNMYDAVQAEGVFVSSPNKYYLKYKIIGMLMFFIGLAGLLYGSLTLPEPAYILFVWAAMMITSLLIIAVAPGLPRRSRRGTQLLHEWMMFRNYLTDKTPINTNDKEQFLNYLPYALVLQCEKEWIHRWHGQAVILPDWYSAENMPYRAEDYEASLLAIIKSLTSRLFTSRPPDIA